MRKEKKVMRRWFFIILGLIFLDQVSKFLILSLFPQIVVYNKGVAFGFLPSGRWVVINFFILTAAACLIKRKLPAGLIIAGGTSNILDRIIRGAVVDFIDFKMLPIFNLADVFICLGVVMIIFKSLTEKINNINILLDN